MTKQTWRFEDNILFGVRSASQEIVDTLRPLVLRFYDLQKAGTSFTQAMRQIKEEFPELVAQYFDFDVEGQDKSDKAIKFTLKKEFVYIESPVTTVQLLNQRSGKSYPITSGEKDSTEMLKVIGFAERGEFTSDFLKMQTLSKITSTLEVLSRGGLLTDAPLPQRPDFHLNRPGIHRLQHASLLYRTKTTGILSDPHFRSVYTPSGLAKTFTFQDVKDHVNGILISHSHIDHFDIPSLMMFGPEIPIVVPKVPQATLLCDNFEKRLKSLGFKNVIAKEWYSDPIQIGDIKISVLPFFGEQPLLSEQPHFKDTWNWGNTYLIQTADYSSWFVIDSGNDARGKMREVAQYISNKWGGVDSILSNLRLFGAINPFYIDNGRYWLTLSTDQKLRFSEMKKDLMTLGPQGAAELCSLAKAKYFLPYAHWWSEIGSFPDLEEGLTKQIVSILQQSKIPTLVLSWKIGDHFLNPKTSKQKKSA